VQRKFSEISYRVIDSLSFDKLQGFFIMEVRIPKADLSRVVSIVQSVVERKSTMPILQNILLTAEDSVLRISSTNLEVAAVVEIPAEVKKKGSITLSGRVFGEIVRELPEDSVQLTLKDASRIEISAGKSVFKVLGTSSDEYPNLAGVSLEIAHRVPARQFAEMISKTIYAVSTDENRFNLNGVCFDLVGEADKKGAGRQLRCVATDGHRLAMISRPISGLQFEDSVIVPTKGLSEIRKILDTQEDSDVAIDIAEGFFLLQTDGTKGPKTKIALRLVDGEFPDYQQVLPKKTGVTVPMEKDQLSQALRRVALMVTDKSKCVTFDFLAGCLRLSSSSPELGEASEELAIDYHAENLRVGFNAKYLLDFCASVGEMNIIEIELHGEHGPAKLVAQGDESSIGIVMPMRLS
jgi:DNA polymerase-3 subunit beta